MATDNDENVVIDEEPSNLGPPENRTSLINEITKIVKDQFRDEIRRLGVNSNSSNGGTQVEPETPANVLLTAPPPPQRGDLTDAQFKEARETYALDLKIIRESNEIVKQHSDVASKQGHQKPHFGCFPWPPRFKTSAEAATFKHSHPGVICNMHVSDRGADAEWTRRIKELLKQYDCPNDTVSIECLQNRFWVEYHPFPN
jgi:hypothetical protein